MTLDLDTFLTALYAMTDDLYQTYFADHKPRRPGKRPELSDSEVLTLAMCSQWLGWSERAFVDYAICNLRPYFPKLLSRSAYNRRCRDLSGVLAGLVAMIAERLGAYAATYQAFDTVPVPLMRRCRGKRHRLFGDEAAIGRGGTDKDWYYGAKLLVAVTDAGVITGFTLAPASTEERWLAEAFLCWRANKWASPLSLKELPSPYRHSGEKYVGPTGPLWPRSAAGAASAVPYITDNGFFGAWWNAHWKQEYGAVIVTPRDYQGKNAEALRRQHASWRQIVETINGGLETCFGLTFCGARSKWGLLTRIAAKLAALNLGIWLNRHFGRPDLAFATLFHL